MPNINDLSEREREILFLVAQGASNKKIAQELFISANTVKVHLRNIFTKIGVSSRTGAAMFAVSVGLVDPVSNAGSEGITVLPADDENSDILRAAEQPTVKIKPLSLVTIFVLMLIIGVSLIFVFREQLSPPQVIEDQLTLEDIQRWRVNAPLPTARRGFAVASYKGQIYAIAGESDAGVIDVVERYDPASNQWTTLSSKKVPVTEVNAAVIGGQIYIPGGRLKSGNLTDIFEVYDPLSDRWEQRASLPIPLSGYALVAFEGKLFLFGGMNGKTYLDSVLVYDPSMDEWSERTPMPTARGYAGAVVSGSNIFVIGGFDGEKALSVNEVYFPERDNAQVEAWSSGTSMPDGQYGMGIASIADIIYVFGGESSKDEKLRALEYLPQVDEWHLIESAYTESWAFLGLVPIETQLYALGGWLDGEITARNLSYKAIYTVNLPLIR